MLEVLSRNVWFPERGGVRGTARIRESVEWIMKVGILEEVGLQFVVVHLQGDKWMSVVLLIILDRHSWRGHKRISPRDICKILLASRPKPGKNTRSPINLLGHIRHSSITESN